MSEKLGRRTGDEFNYNQDAYPMAEEAAGRTVARDGTKYKQFYGMSSATAMTKHSGGVAE